MTKSEINDLKDMLKIYEEHYDLDKYSTDLIATAYVLGYGLDDVLHSEMSYRGLDDLTDEDYDMCYNVEKELNKLLDRK